MTFLLFLLLFLIVILFLLLCFIILGYFLGYLFTRVPFVSSSKKNLSQILEIMDLKKGETLIDLGCGDARLLIAAEKKYKVKTIGYELSPAAFFISKLNVFLKKSKTKIFFKDFFQADLSQADVIFCYLFPFLMKKISEKLKSDLKPKARIISLAFPLPDWPNERIEYLDKKNKKGKIFIYQK